MNLFKVKDFNDHPCRDTCCEHLTVNQDILYFCDKYNEELGSIDDSERQILILFCAKYKETNECFIDNMKANEEKAD